MPEAKNPPSPELADRLRESEERFRAFMDHCPAATFLKDADDRFWNAHPAWRAQFDPPPTMWEGKTDHDFWPRETADLFQASDRACLESGLFRAEETATGTDGVERTWLVMKLVFDAANGERPLRVAATFGVPVRLLVTEVVMPGMGGRELAERILTEQPEMKVLKVSRYKDDAVVRHGVASDRVHFLPKPYTPTALVNKVAEVLESGV